MGIGGGRQSSWVGRMREGKREGAVGGNGRVLDDCSGEVWRRAKGGEYTSDLVIIQSMGE